MKTSDSFFALFACFAVISSSSCTTPSRNATVVDVPFIPQESANQCGVVALAMAMDHYGVPYSIDNLVSKAFIPYLDGSSLQLLADTASQYGLTVTHESADIRILRQMLVDKCLPLIYLAPRKGEPTGHFALVTGITNNLRYVRMHGRTRPDCWIRLSRLRRHATEDGFPTLCLRPAPPEPLNPSSIRQ